MMSLCVVVVSVLKFIAIESTASNVLDNSTFELVTGLATNFLATNALVINPLNSSIKPDRLAANLMFNNLGANTSALNVANKMNFENTTTLPLLQQLL